MPKNKHQEFKPNAAAESAFMKQLKKVARAAGNLVESHIEHDKILNETKLIQQLIAYSESLGPWARSQSARLLTGISKKNHKAFKQKSEVMGDLLKAHLAQGDVGITAAALMEEQVALIKSIPIQAGRRAQALAAQSLVDGTRASEIADELLNTTSVTVARATLIARTETARANASLTQARAVGIGAKGYIWRTTMDGAERDSHAQMNGKPIDYMKPPTLSDGTKGHAGTFPNCRCWQDVIFDD